MTTKASPAQITIGGELRVNRIGYGAMKLTGDQVWGPYPDHDRALRVLRGVVDAGINLIDTTNQGTMIPTFPQVRVLPVP